MHSWRPLRSSIEKTFPEKQETTGWLHRQRASANSVSSSAAGGKRNNSKDGSKGFVPAIQINLKVANYRGLKRIQPHQKEDLERLAQYIIRTPFSVEKMQPDPESGTIIYRSDMTPKIRRNFEIFTPCDFIAAITQHIPDKGF